MTGPSPESVLLLSLGHFPLDGVEARFASSSEVAAAAAESVEAGDCDEILFSASRDS